MKKTIKHGFGSVRGLCRRYWHEDGSNSNQKLCFSDDDFDGFIEEIEAYLAEH